MHNLFTGKSLLWIVYINFTGLISMHMLVSLERQKNSHFLCSCSNAHNDATTRSLVRALVGAVRHKTFNIGPTI